MALDLRKLAQEETTFCKLGAGREKGSVEELIREGEVTINNIEYLETVNEDGVVDHFYAFTVKESKKFFYSGAVLTNIIDGLIEKHGESEIYSAFIEQGLRTKFSLGKTKKGRPCTIVDII